MKNLIWILKFIKKSLKQKIKYDIIITYNFTKEDKKCQKTIK